MSTDERRRKMQLLAVAREVPGAAIPRSGLHFRLCAPRGVQHPVPTPLMVRLYSRESIHPSRRSSSCTLIDDALYGKAYKRISGLHLPGGQLTVPYTIYVTLCPYTSACVHSRYATKTVKQTTVKKQQTIACGQTVR